MACQRFLLYFHTLRWLRPGQFVNRVWRLLPRRAPRVRLASERRSPAVAFSQGISRDSIAILPDRVRFLNLEAQFAPPQIWTDASKPKLWLYNLHYFDDLSAPQPPEWPARLIEMWIDGNPVGRGIGWDPYPLSRRVCNWIKWDLAGNRLSARAVASVETQIRYLLPRLEYHLLCNHLLANLKALVMAGCFIDAPAAASWLARGLRELQDQLEQQLLPDGGHIELSPMYQAILLEDLLDIVAVLRCYQFEVPAWLVGACRRMFRWCEVMVQPDGDWVQFNDTSLGSSPRLVELREYLDRLGVGATADTREPALLASGFVRAERGAAILFADVGNLGVDYNPAHGHADTLTYELSWHGERLVVDTGISTYEPDSRRAYERSTQAHNTVVIDGENSSEVWGAFRVARRAKARNVRVQLESPTASLFAEHDGYQRLVGRPIHCREWRLTTAGLDVIDTIRSAARHEVRSYVHLHPRFRATAATPNGAAIVGPGGEPVARLSAAADADVRIETYEYARQFGARERGDRIVLAWQPGGSSAFSYSLSFNGRQT